MTRRRHRGLALALAVVLLGSLPEAGIYPKSAAVNKTAPAVYLTDIFAKALDNTERSFYRRQSELSATGTRPSAPISLSELTPYGFIPTPAILTMSVTALDTRQSVVCMRMRVDSKDLMRAAAQLLARPGVSRATSACEVLSGTLQPLSWPMLIYAVKVLDTQNVMTRTMLPPSIPIQGVDANAVTRPAFTLNALIGQWSTGSSFTVTNPAQPAMDGQPAAPTLDITAASVREGFRVSHNCTQVLAQQSCTVTVQYQGAAERYRVGSLKLQFGDGSVAVIGLLGVTVKQLPADNGSGTNPGGSGGVGSGVGGGVGGDGGGGVGLPVTS